MVIKNIFHRYGHIIYWWIVLFGSLSMFSCSSKIESGELHGNIHPGEFHIDAHWTIEYNEVEQTAGGLIDTSSLPKVKTTWINLRGSLENNSGKLQSSASFHLLIDSPRWSESKDLDFTVEKQMKTGEKTEFTIGQYIGKNYIPISNIRLKTAE